MTSTKSAENKLKKKLPNLYVENIKPVDILDSGNRNGRSSMSAKELYMLDIQSFFCQIFCKQLYTVWPRWCRMVKPDNFTSVHLIVLDELSSYAWSECLIQYSTSKKFQKYYEKIMEKLCANVKFINPKFYGLSWKTEFFEIPYTFLSKKFNLLTNMKSDGKPNLKRNFQRQLKSLFNSEVDSLILIRHKYQLDFSKKSSEFKRKPDAFPRTQLLMNANQMQLERVPLADQENSRWDDFKYSIPTGYATVTANSPLFAIDCEMVECHDEATDRFVKGLASISIVNEDRETVYKTYVKPTKVIVNYLTKYSGITYEIMQEATRTLEDVQRDIAQILPTDAILVGHSIANDLEALQIFHPYLIDTSVIYNLRQNRILKPKLKMLSYIFLNREIQNNKGLGHDSYEDAMATMDLVLLKLSKSLDFGDVVSSSNEKNDSSTNEEEEETEKMEVDEFPTLTNNPIHLRHRQLLNKFYQKNETVNLLKFVDKSHIETVASVNDDLSWFSKPWFSESLTEQVVENSESIDKTLESIDRTSESIDKTSYTSAVKNFRSHPLKISEISFKDLPPNELPNKKWFTRLLKKIHREFNSLPGNALCGLLIPDGPYCSEQEFSEFGKAYFGVTPPTVTVETVSMNGK